jgi:hypothetical protein
MIQNKLVNQGTSFGRPYGSFTARRKAVRFVYGPSEGRTVHFIDHKQDLQPA